MSNLPPKAICVPCGREYEAGPGKTGAIVEAFLKGGTSYYKVMGDIWVCPGCGHRAVLGFAGQTAESHDEGYEDFLGLPIDVRVTL